MSDASSGDPRVQNLTSEEVARGIQEGRMLLVDVREPNEVDAEAYPDAVVIPLSSFDPTANPDPQGKQVVFACPRGGDRSRRHLRPGAGLSVQRPSRRRHTRRKAAGFPTEI